MEKTLRVLNRMVRWRDRTVRHLWSSRSGFFIEPVNTNDLDVFFHVKDPGAGLNILAPLYEYLSDLGYKGHKEAIDIEGWPVQFLPIFNSLLEEAVGEASEVPFQRTKTRVMQAEHLVAIMLQTGRLKDHARIAQFVEHEVIEQDRLTDILSRHGLLAKWKKFNRAK